MRLLLLVSFLLGSVTVHAQVPAAAIAADPSRRTETLPTIQSRTAGALPVPGAETPSTSDFKTIPGSTDNDIGEQRILQETPKSRPFRFSTDALLYHSTNAAHLSAGELDDWYFGSRVATGWQHVLGERFVVDLSVLQDMYVYDELDILDFESLETAVSLLYALPWGKDFFLIGQYHFNRLTQDFEDIMLSHSGRFGVQKAWAINRRNTINLALLGDWDIDTDVDALKRHQYTGALTWTFKLIPKVNLILGYNYIFYDYTEYDRDDHLHNVGLSLNWTPFNWLDVYASYNHSFNESNINAFDYEDGTAGLGLGLRLRF